MNLLSGEEDETYQSLQQVRVFLLRQYFFQLFLDVDHEEAHLDEV